MKIQNVQAIYHLEQGGCFCFSSRDLTHVFRVIARLMHKRMSEVTVKQAMDCGFLIRRG
jgi:hypothetical protein